MNDEIEFKDKEISKIASDLTKEGKHEFGNAFKNAIKQNEGNLEVHVVTTPPVVAETVSPTETQTQASPDATKKEYDPVLKTLRTYERDIADAIRTRDTSVASISIAKQKKEQEQTNLQPASENEKKSLPKTERVARSGLTIFVSIILIIASIGLAGFIVYFMANRPEPVVPAETAIITTEEKHTLDVTSLESATIQNRIIEIERASSGQNKIASIELVDGVAENKLPISAENFFLRVALNAPSTLARAFGNQWLIGFQHINQTIGSTTITAAPFIFVSVSSFDSAFDGMLRWESMMTENLSPLFVNQDIRSALTPNKKFEDKIIRNKDVRILRDTSGNPILMYSFLDQKHLLITTNEQTFQEILSRFLASQIVR